MKKIILHLMLLLLVLPAMSQYYITVQGTVTDLATGNPIPNQAVIYHNDSVPAGGYFYQTTYTDIMGQYYDTVYPAPTQGNLYIGTVDCQNYLQTQWFTFNPAQNNFTANFSICYNSIPCSANFSYLQNAPFVVNFYDQSVGGGTQRTWNFGDGTTSNLLNPVHTYAQAGYYNVTLTIGALGTTCHDTISQTIYVTGNSGGGCQSAFYFVPDSSSNNTFLFFNQSTGNIFSYLWDFGDGGTSNLVNPVHQFAAPGIYTVCLTVQGDSNCFDVSCQTIYINSGGNCQAAYVAIPDSSNSLAYTFYDQSTGNIATWTWNFYDGTPPVTVNNPNPVYHQFPGPGNYMVCLTVSDSANICSDMICDTIIIGGSTGCQAYFYGYPDSNTVSGSYQFVDLSIGNINSWSWNFGDPASGINNTSTLQNPVHVFSAPGSYNVCLTVQGADSTCHDTYCTTIVVQGGGGCQAYFDYSSIPASMTVSFFDLSSGNPTNWQWSFGDGTSSSDQNPVHTYAAAGTYMATLTIWGNNCQSSVTKPVYVTDTTSYHQVYGQVFAGNFPVTSGLVMIFSLDTTANTLPYFGVSPLDSNGVYYFTMVPDGNFYIQAIPLESSGYLPTYFGNTIYWQYATLVMLGTPVNPYNISLVATEQMVGGPGSVSGQIGMGDVASVMLDKINMIIKNEQGNPIGYTHVTTDGDFGFASLAYGTYRLRPELPGAASDEITITLSAANPHAEVNMTYSGNSILGINDVSGLVEQVKVYPVPAKDNLYIDLIMKQSVTVKFELVNMLGTVIHSESKTLLSGKNNLRTSVSGLPAGFYSYRITSEEGISLSGKIVITR
jgi:PKD repeat protein